jgi:hypothetical protein
LLSARTAKFALDMNDQLRQIRYTQGSIKKRERVSPLDKALSRTTITTGLLPLLVMVQAKSLLCLCGNGGSLVIMALRIWGSALTVEHRATFLVLAAVPSELVAKFLRCRP